MRKSISRLFAALVLTAAIMPIAASAQTAAPTVPKPYVVEWLYRVQYGHKDEWWSLFRKYQIAALDREQQLGYITSYTVYGPSLHTSEDGRWDYRVTIVFKSAATLSRSGHSPQRRKPPMGAHRQSLRSSHPHHRPAR